MPAISILGGLQNAYNNINTSINSTVQTATNFGNSVINGTTSNSTINGLSTFAQSPVAGQIFNTFSNLANGNQSVGSIVGSLASSAVSSIPVVGNILAPLVSNLFGDSQPVNKIVDCDVSPVNFPHPQLREFLQDSNPNPFKYRGPSFGAMVLYKTVWASRGVSKEWLLNNWDKDPKFESTAYKQAVIQAQNEYNEQMRRYNENIAFQQAQLQSSNNQTQLLSNMVQTLSTPRPPTYTITGQSSSLNLTNPSVMMPVSEIIRPVRTKDPDSTSTQIGNAIGGTAGTVLGNVLTAASQMAIEKLSDGANKALGIAGAKVADVSIKEWIKAKWQLLVVILVSFFGVIYFISRKPITKKRY